MADAEERVRRLAADRYGDPELVDAILEDAGRLGTIDMIDSGERVLPHPRDARVWHDRITGRTGLTPEQREKARSMEQREKQLADKEARLDALLRRAAKLTDALAPARANEEKEGD